MNNLMNNRNQPHLKDQNDWKPKDWAERLGKKMRISERDIKLFKLSLFQGMK